MIPNIPHTLTKPHSKIGSEIAPQYDSQLNICKKTEDTVEATIKIDSPATYQNEHSRKLPCRNVCLGSTASPAFKFKKLKGEETGKSLFFRNIKDILSYDVVLGEIPYFKDEVITSDGKVFDKFRTCCISELNSIKEEVNSLEEKELMLNIIVRDFGNRIHFKLCLHSNEGEEVNNEKIQYEFCHFLSPEFFSFGFWLDFSESGELETIEPERGVNIKLQRKGICRDVSLNILRSVYDYFGSEDTKLRSRTAGKIGTVKFYYPLNKYFRISSGEHLRDFDPRSNTIGVQDVTQRSEPLSDFKIVGQMAQCPHKYINLKKLLHQYEFRSSIEKFTGST